MFKANEKKILKRFLRFGPKPLGVPQCQLDIPLHDLMNYGAAKLWYQHEYF